LVVQEVGKASLIGWKRGRPDPRIVFSDPLRSDGTFKIARIDPQVEAMLMPTAIASSAGCSIFRTGAFGASTSEASGFPLDAVGLAPLVLDNCFPFVDPLTRS
jgi:hypothetical protein